MSVELLGYRINDFEFSEAVDNALKLAKENKVSQIVTINPEMFEAAEYDSEFSKIIDEAEMVVPDGIGVKIGLKLNGYDVERIPGVDLAKELLHGAADEKIPVAIIGAKEEIIIKAIENIKTELSNLNITYYHNGYFNDDNFIYEELKKSEARIILVAMGSPRQEKFIYNAKEVLPYGVMIGIGGSLDVWSGVVKRAPEIYQKLGMEWLYRTLSQPERIKRIFPAIPLFLLKVLKSKYFE
ncbi:MAG: WecB/TagA/CpsF family glycosyltransferase [bacterium]|nr:WecB/TagA/CpsF family glycosyltransferase [bacterium]